LLVISCFAGRVTKFFYRIEIFFLAALQINFTHGERFF
jgi:hypothetical protein